MNVFLQPGNEAVLRASLYW